MKKFAFTAGESLNGAVARWAAANDIDRMIDVTAAAGMEHRHRAQPATLDIAQLHDLASFMDVDVEELLRRATPPTAGSPGNQFATLIFNGVAVPSLIVEKRHRRFSPAAVRDRSFHRQAWDLRMFPFCSEAWQLLRDDCGNPDCEPKLGWTYTLGIDRCEHCMEDLGRVPADGVPRELHDSLRDASGILSHDPAVRSRVTDMLPAEIRSLGASELIGLMLKLMPVMDQSLPLDLGRMMQADALQLCHAVSSTWMAVLDWPHGMTRAASDLVARRTGKHNDGNGGRTMRLITPKQNAGTSPPILDLIAGWRRSVDLSLPENDRLRDSTISPYATSRLVGLDTAKVVEHRRRGVLSTTFVLDLDRPEGRFDRAEIEAIGAALPNRSSVEACRSRLGMACNGVEQLCAMGMLDYLPHCFFEAHYGARQVDGTSIDRLIRDLAAARGGSDCTVSLRTAMKQVGGDLKPWGPAFALLLAGKLPFVLGDADDRITESVRISPRSANVLRELIIPDEARWSIAEFVSKADAAEVLNLTPRQSTALLQAVPTDRGTHEKAMAIEEVLRLARCHIAPIELALRRNLPVGTAYAEAVRAGVPLLGPGGFSRAAAESLYF